MSPFSPFRFHHLRFNLRDFCSSTDVKQFNDPRLLLDYVKEQCQLGFYNLHLPLNLFRQMTSLPHRPSLFHFSRLFAAMLKLKRLQPHSTVIALSLHLELSGTRPDLHFIGTLANCYCQLGRVDFGFSLLAKSLKLGYPFESNIILFDTLINGLVENGQLGEAVKLLDVAVIKLGIQLDLPAYGTMFKGLCRVGDNAGALNLLRQMKSSTSSCKPGIVIYSTLINSLCKDSKNDMLSEALKLFSIMKTDGIQPNVFTYTSLIRGLFKLGRKADAKAMLVEMKDNNISPNVATYTMLVDMHCKNRMLDEAEAIIQMMHERGVTPNVLTYNALLDGYCLCGQMDKAREIVDLMVKTHCHPDVVIYSTLINGYVKLKLIDKALDILQEMFQQGIALDVVGYTTLIDGLCKSNRITLARKLFSDMQVSGIKPDVCAYSALLDGLCKNSQLDEAVALLVEMESNGVAPNLFIFNILVHSLCEAGQVKDAEKLVSDHLSRGLVPDHVIYTTLIKGFCNKGLMSRAIELLDEMKQVGCSPDAFSYNTIITGFIINNDMPNALRYREITVNMGFEANTSTSSLLLGHLSQDNPEYLQKVQS